MTRRRSPADPLPTKGWRTVKELTEEYRWSTTSACRVWLRRKEIPHIRRGRIMLFDRLDVEHVMRGRTA